MCVEQSVFDKRHSTNCLRLHTTGIVYVNHSAWRSWAPEESQVESYEDQDDAKIHHQPFPESISEEHEIYSDYKGCRPHHVKHGRYLSAHLSLPSPGFTKRHPGTPGFGRIMSCLAGFRLLQRRRAPNECQIRPTPISVRDGCGSGRGWYTFATHA